MRNQCNVRTKAESGKRLEDLSIVAALLIVFNEYRKGFLNSSGIPSIA